LSEEGGIEAVVKKIKGRAKGGTDIDEVVDLINKSKVNELKTLAIERLMEEEKAKLEEARRKQQPPNMGVATNFLQNIMQIAQIDPKRAKEFLDSLSEEDIAKLSMLAASGQTGSITGILPFLRSPSTPIKDVVEIVKLMNPVQNQPTLDLKGLAEIFKAGVEAAKTQQPQAEPIQQFQVVKDLIQPFYEMMSQKDQQLWNERFERLQSQIIDPVSYLKNMKETLKELGLGGTSENIDPQLQLEIEKLRTEREMQLEKLRAERQQWAAKFNAEQAAEERRWQVVGSLMQGPLGRVVERLGGAAATRLQTEGSQTQAPRPVAVQCPSCGHTFWASSDAETVICPNCKSQLQKMTGGQPETVPQQSEQTEPPSEQA